MNNHSSWAKKNHGAGVRTDREVAEIISEAIGAPYHENYVRHFRIKAERKLAEALRNDPVVMAALSDGLGISTLRGVAK